MGRISYDCPNCGRQLGTVSDRSPAHGTKVCPGCRVRIRYDWDPKTSSRVSVGRA